VKSERGFSTPKVGKAASAKGSTARTAVASVLSDSFATGGIRWIPWMPTGSLARHLVGVSQSFRRLGAA